jgi:hypothetical protein
MITQGEEGWVIGELKDGKELRRAIRYFFSEDLRNRAPDFRREKREVYSEKVNFDKVMRILEEAIKH